MNTLDLPKQIVGAIAEVVSKESAQLHEPSFDGNEYQYLKECLQSTYVSSFGDFIRKFERGLEDFTGIKHAIAVVNGTAALHIALIGAGVKKDDEVLVPSLTFIATANAVSYCNAVPHFVDSEEASFGINIKKLRIYLQDIVISVGGISINRKTGRPIRALIAVHVFGHTTNLDDLVNLAMEFNLTLVEDCAESLGSYYKSQHTGSFGLVSAFSFNGNKIITTGGGGAILTNDDALSERVRHLVTTAKVKHEWGFVHDEIGYNYRMPNLNAALGCAQLENLKEKLRSKRALYDIYRKKFELIQSVKLMSEPCNCESNYWLQTLILDLDVANLRDEILSKANTSGFMTRPLWRLMHKLKPYSECPRMNLDVAELLEKRAINLPSSPNLANG